MDLGVPKKDEPRGRSQGTKKWSLDSVPEAHFSYNYLTYRDV